MILEARTICKNLSNQFHELRTSVYYLLLFLLLWISVCSYKLDENLRKNDMTKSTSEWTECIFSNFQNNENNWINICGSKPNHHINLYSTSWFIFIINSHPIFLAFIFYPAVRSSLNLIISKILKKYKRYFIKSNNPKNKKSLSLWLYNNINNNINSNKSPSTCCNTVTTMGMKTEKKIPELLSNRKTSFFKKKSFSLHSYDKNKIDRLLVSSDFTNGISAKIDDEIKNMQLLKLFSPNSTENHDYGINDEIDDEYLVYLNDNKIENKLDTREQKTDDNDNIINDNNNKNNNNDDNNNDNNNNKNENNCDDNIKIATGVIVEKKKSTNLNDIDNYVICRKESLRTSSSRQTSNGKIIILEKLLSNDEKIIINEQKIIINENIKISERIIINEKITIDGNITINEKIIIKETDEIRNKEIIKKAIIISGRENFEKDEKKMRTEKEKIEKVQKRESEKENERVKEKENENENEIEKKEANNAETLIFDSDRTYEVVHIEDDIKSINDHETIKVTPAKSGWARPAEFLA